ncbi:MAG: hypothetical protein Q8N47_11810 [Bryobacterales bacterium]|nr:hypothetical protein [Bryobacterales bacterium]
MRSRVALRLAEPWPGRARKSNDHYWLLAARHKEEESAAMEAVIRQ